MSTRVNTNTNVFEAESFFDVELIDQFGLPDLVTITQLEIGDFLAPFVDEIPEEPPLDFAHHTLGHTTWSTPAAILDALGKPRARVAVKSCHASGKTFTAAEAVLWWTCSVKGIALTSAPTGRQARKVLWAEIKKQYRKALRPLGGYMMQSPEFRYSESNYALGFATDDPVNWQGFHEDKVLIVLDEAPGISDDTYDAIMGISAGGDVRILLIGNPVIVGGRFWKIFHDERSRWDTFSIDAFDTPNLAPLNLHDPDNFAEFVALDHDDPILNDNPWVGLTSRHYVHEAFHEWGVTNPQWQSRVRGDFPEFDEYALYSLSWLEQARNRRVSEQELAGHNFEGGLDIAGPGKDETVLCIREGPRIHGIWAWKKPDTKQDVLALCRKFHGIATAKGKTFKLKADAEGIGYHYALDLKKEGVPVMLMRASSKPRDPERFPIAKDEWYWHLRELLRDGAIANLEDDQTISQAVAIRWAPDNRGRNKIESKEELRARGIKSPDRIEAVVMAFARPVGMLPSSRRQHATAGKRTKRRQRY